MKKTFIISFFVIIFNYLLYSQKTDNLPYGVDVQFNNENIILIIEGEIDKSAEITVLNENYLLYYFGWSSGWGVGNGNRYVLVFKKNNEKKIIGYYNRINEINDTTWAFKTPEYLNEYGETVKASIDTFVIKGKGVFVINNNDELQLINATNLPLDIKAEITNINIYDNFGIIRTNKNKYGVINNKLYVISPCDYDTMILNLEKNLIIAKKNKWGIINIEGKEIVPFKYDNLESFVGNKARIELNGKKGYVDINGNETWEN
ncbi:MAG TPA: WG repeat-containing protein [Bacteroidales bacterium]|nr:WG repeat-containing protein [Bacteroidales bacterium]